MAVKNRSKTPAVQEELSAPRVRIPHDPHRIGRSLSVEDHPSWQRRFSVTSAAPTLDSSPRCDGSSSVSRTSPSTREVVGYSLIEADDMTAALELARNHPHLNMPGGCEIEVHEAQPIPGM